MARVFISYASADHEFVQKEVVGLVRALGLETWFAPANIRSADLWEDAIGSGLEGSDWFVLIVSSSSISSGWVKKELGWALDHLEGRIIPLVIDDSDPGLINERLRSIQYVDFRANRSDAVQHLVQRLVNSQYKGFERHLEGKWICAVQPVYYSRPRRFLNQSWSRKLIRTLLSRWFSGTADWHIQDVLLTPSENGYVIDTVQSPGTLQWRWDAYLVGSNFLVGPWVSKRRSSGSHGYMSVQISRNGTYMFGHDYAVVLEEAKAHYGVLILGKDESCLENAWSAMRHARRAMPRLTRRIDFPDS